VVVTVVRESVRVRPSSRSAPPRSRSSHIADDRPEVLAGPEIALQPSDPRTTSTPPRRPPPVSVRDRARGGRPPWGGGGRYVASRDRAPRSGSAGVEVHGCQVRSQPDGAPSRIRRNRASALVSLVSTFTRDSDRAVKHTPVAQCYVNQRAALSGQMISRMSPTRTQPGHPFT